MAEEDRPGVDRVREELRREEAPDADAESPGEPEPGRVTEAGERLEDDR